MITVPTNHGRIKAYTFTNGQEARFVDPFSLDRAQTYLLSGRSWALPTISVNGTSIGGKIPLLLRPWTAYLLIGAKACVSDPETGEVRISVLAENGVDRLSLGGDLVLTEATIPTLPTPPLGEQEWAGIPWVYTGAVGQVTPPIGDNTGTIQIAPTNGWVRCLLSVTCTDAEVNNLYVKTWASTAPITAGV